MTARSIKVLSFQSNVFSWFLLVDMLIKVPNTKGQNDEWNNGSYLRYSEISLTTLLLFSSFTMEAIDIPTIALATIIPEIGPSKTIILY